MVDRKQPGDGKGQSRPNRLVKERTAELIGAGMESNRAREQARAEFEHGILTLGCCHLEDETEGRQKPRNRKGNVGPS
jgi:hypothetical protein